MYVFVLPDIQKQLCTKNGVSLLDVSEMFVSGVSSMYIYIMHYWNFFVMLNQKLDFSFFESFIYNKSDVNFPFYKF